MKIVVLDGHTSNPGDLSWTNLEDLGDLKVWPRTSDDKLIERAIDAEVLVVNKRTLREKDLDQLPNVKCICTLATGYNNIDVAFAKERGIIVSNAVGYSSPSVAQHVFAMVLHHYNNIDSYFQDVREGKWASSTDFNFYTHPFAELAGRNIGIYGFGKIGQAVGNIAKALGMNILVISRGEEKDVHEGVDYVNENEFLNQSDVITLHAPLSNANKEYMDSERLSQMKETAILVNTGRGGLINEMDLKSALENEVIAAAYLDVLSQEPPSPGHILQNVTRCFITPHIAWATGASRKRLIGIVADNIRAFQKGKPQNVVD
ncbi:MAG: D-2-hydroxyacid dehydrogenase [Saprospiraceae bacterium]|nr:D-2-hydroxyacid dehydrogenase [Saprospiraceae bacterium]